MQKAWIKLNLSDLGGLRGPVAEQQRAHEKTCRSKATRQRREWGLHENKMKEQALYAGLIACLTTRRSLDLRLHRISNAAVIIDITIAQRITLAGVIRRRRLNLQTLAASRGHHLGFDLSLFARAFELYLGEVDRKRRRILGDQCWPSLLAFTDDLPLQFAPRLERAFLGKRRRPVKQLIRVRTAICNTFSLSDFGGISCTFSQYTDSRSSGKPCPEYMMRTLFSLSGSRRKIGGVSANGVLARAFSVPSYTTRVPPTRMPACAGSAAAHKAPAQRASRTFFKAEINWSMSDPEICSTLYHHSSPAEDTQQPGLTEESAWICMG